MNYCRKCGKELRVDDRFCPSCGLPLDEGDATQAEAPTGEVVLAERPVTTSPGERSPITPPVAAETMPQPDAVSAAKGSPWRWIVPLVVVLVIAVIATVVILATHKKATQNVAAQKSAAQQAIKPFQKLDSALTVGLNFATYGTDVQDAQYALDSYSPSDKISKEIRAHLATAASAYKAADDAWNDSIQTKFTGNKLTAQYWIDQYPVLLPQMPDGTASLTASKVEQAAWAIATPEIAAAAQLVTTYQTTQ